MFTQILHMTANNKQPKAVTGELISRSILYSYNGILYRSLKVSMERSS